MNERIHRALDGDLSRDVLTGDEQRELAAYEAAFRAAGVEDVAHESPDVSGAVMWRIAHLQPEPAPPALAARLLAPLRWLVRPQALTLRPAVALGLVVLALGAGALAGSRGAAPGADEPLRLLVQFRMSVEGATDVALVGDFSGWERRFPLEEVAPGVWSTTLPLEPGIYDYAYVVDGETWALDPLAPAVADGFGGANSRLAVLAPERGEGAL